MKSSIRTRKGVRLTKWGDNFCQFLWGKNPFTPFSQNSKVSMRLYVLFVALVLVTTLVVGLTSLSAIFKNKDDYMTVKELKDFCTQSGVCGRKLCCEGKEVKVRGYVDPVNIFDESRYPTLPYQKFRIVDNPRDLHSNDFLEIYPKEGNRKELFERIYKLINRPNSLIHICGKIEGFDAHTNVGVHRFYYLTINAKNVFIDTE